MAKPKIETEEFIITYVKEKKLNEFIGKFRELNPGYKVLNISLAGTAIGIYVVWKRL